MRKPKTNKKVLYSTHYWDAMYKANFYFFAIDSSAEEAMSIINTWMHKNVKQYRLNKLDITDISKNNAGGRCIEIIGLGYIIWVGDTNIIDYLDTSRHELDHAIYWLYQSRGVEIDYENSEPHTYYAGLLTRNLVYPVLEKIINSKYKRIK